MVETQRHMPTVLLIIIVRPCQQLMSQHMHRFPRCDDIRSSELNWKSIESSILWTLRQSHLLPYPYNYPSHSGGYTPSLGLSPTQSWLTRPLLRLPTWRSQASNLMDTHRVHGKSYSYHHVPSLVVPESPPQCAAAAVPIHLICC